MLCTAHLPASGIVLHLISRSLLMMVRLWLLSISFFNSLSTSQCQCWAIPCMLLRTVKIILASRGWRKVIITSSLPVQKFESRWLQQLELFVFLDMACIYFVGETAIGKHTFLTPRSAYSNPVGWVVTDRPRRLGYCDWLLSPLCRL